MRKKTNFLFLSLTLVIFFAIVSGGCGGGGSSSSSNNGSSDNSYSTSNKAVMLGTMSQERANEVKNSNLYSYIVKRLSETASVSTADENEDEFDIESLNNGDILFISDASELLNIDNATRSQIMTAYYNLGVAIVAVYPDSDDLKAMEELFNVNLSRPVSADGTPLTNPHYEFLGLGWRQITDEGAANTFIYAGDHKDNIEEFYGLDDKFESGDIVIERKNFKSDDEYAIAILRACGLTDAEVKEFEKVFTELAAEYYEGYVQNLFEWAAGLDKQKENITADFVADVAKLKAHIAEENEKKDNTKEIEGFASASYTQWHDSINREFCDYFREFGENKNNSAFKEFVYQKSGHENYDRLLRYWSPSGSRNKTGGQAIPVKHEANASYRVMSLHSFKNNADYYIIGTDTTTKPVDLWVCAPKGDRTRDELEGGDAGLSYHYNLIFGGNRGLSAKVWASVPEADIEKYMPNRTANKETTVNDTTAWNIGGGVTVGVEGGLNAGAPGLTVTGKLGTSFTWGISHETTKSWSVSDYEIVPNIHYDDKGRQVAQWDLKCTWPTYSSRSDSWQMSSAFRRNVSFETESIWKIPSSKRSEAKFYGQTLWINGFCWAHDMPSQAVKSYNAEVPHEGMVKELTTPRPPLLGVGDIITTGGKEAKMYTAKILSEANWTATSDSDWLTVVDKSGSATGENGEDFNYRVTENNTGRSRIGNITIIAGDYIAKITFTQSPYVNQNKK